MEAGTDSIPHPLSPYLADDGPLTSVCVPNATIAITRARGELRVVALSEPLIPWLAGIIFALCSGPVAFSLARDGMILAAAGVFALAVLIVAVGRVAWPRRRLDIVASAKSLRVVGPLGGLHVEVPVGATTDFRLEEVAWPNSELAILYRLVVGVPDATHFLRLLFLDRESAERLATQLREALATLRSERGYRD